MKQYLQSHTVTVGLAIFSMFFGAGNLIFPIKLGLMAGSSLFTSLTGFFITGICLPLLGLATMILYNGDYKAFFHRLGKGIGNGMILICMLIIGPVIAMPRIVTLSHIMVAPFLGNISLPLFSFLFLFFTFLACYKESKIISLLGNLISPLLLASLVIIIGKGAVSHTGTIPTFSTARELFLDGITIGYNTLDLLGALFFSSIVLTLLQKNTHNSLSLTQRALIGFKAGCLGLSLLALIYVGMSYLGAWFGHGFEHLNEGQLFSAVSFQILGSYGAIIIAVAVLMACYSTIIALAAITAEYVQHTITRKRITYISSLCGILGATLCMSNLGLERILYFSIPILTIGYPVLIVLTLMNFLHKVYGIRMVKLPVLLTFMSACIFYLR